ncbi:hypothetical protein ONZ45_g16762 [Pleurotus djamor]|nr:hypothetical protein ONZ45_g16762 [Pleurotus djamor]
MISLLAGTTTSPDKKFPAYTPPEDPLLGALRQKRERKAITTVINGVVSVLGTGIGVWWISDKTGFKDEWRVLLAFSAAIIVALSEVILFIIWQSKSSAPKRSFRPENKRDQSEAIELPHTPTGVSNAIEDRAVDLRERIKHSST